MIIFICVFYSLLSTHSIQQTIFTRGSSINIELFSQSEIISLWGGRGLTNFVSENIDSCTWPLYMHVVQLFFLRSEGEGGRRGRGWV